MILLYGYVDEIFGTSGEINKKSAESAAGRMLLATLLAKTGIEATLDDIKTEETGKPYLEGFSGVEFNITHSKGFVACVLSLGEGRVGVDAEPSEIAYSLEKQKAFADRFFSESERDSLALGEKSFSELWTRREACLKMTGAGFVAGVGKPLDDANFATFCIDGYTVTVAAESDAQIEIIAYNK